MAIPTTTRHRRLQQLRDPRLLASLAWKNVKHLLAPRRPEGRRLEEWNNIGRALAERGRYEEALSYYDRALALRPDIAELLSNRGSALCNLGRLDEAETSVREALRLNPDLANAHNNLGSVLLDRAHFQEAAEAYNKALCLEPNRAHFHHNLGKVLFYLGRAAEAQARCREAVRLQPDRAEFHTNLSYALLLAGQLEEGWKEFEWRWKRDGGPRLRKFFVPYWNGEPLGNRVILLHADQGLGDTIQFCRFVPQIAASARVVLEVQQPLVGLLAQLPGIMTIIGRGDPLPPFDLHCPLLRLPCVLGTTLDTIPATPYLAADPAAVARWRQRLAGYRGLRVGLCWAGGKSSFDREQIAVDARRSIALDTLGPLAGVPEVSFFSLQKGPPAAQVANPPPGMEVIDFDVEDFAEEAALIDALDLVISVDTVIAHFAGALGKPVWLLNHFDTCWRWLQHRDDSPWYGELRQFRQSAPGDWQGVIMAVRNALQLLAAGDLTQLQPRQRFESHRPAELQSESPVSFS